MRRNLAAADRTISELLETAHEIAVGAIETEARRILREHPNLDEFVMAMGSTFFTAKSDGQCLDLDYAVYMQFLRRVVDEWTDTLKITGTPMRFTATGPKITPVGD